MRLGEVDRYRWLAALAIVWIHTATSQLALEATLCARFAVPFFAVTLGYFAAQSTKPFTAYAAQRARSLYLPFLAWTVIYLGVRYLAAWALHHSAPAIPPFLSLISSGSAQHLWFLPFGFVLSITAYALRQRPRWALLGVLLAVAVTLLPRPHQGSLGYFLGLAHDNLLPGLAGIWLAAKGPLQENARIRAASWVVALLAMGFELSLGRNAFIEAGLGLSIFLATASAPAGQRDLDTRLGALAFGVYVVHVLFVEGFQDGLAYVLGSSGSPSLSLSLDLFVFASAAIASVGATLVLRRSSWTRWLV